MSYPGRVADSRPMPSARNRMPYQMSSMDVYRQWTPATSVRTVGHPVMREVGMHFPLFSQLFVRMPHTDDVNSRYHP
jgi:hypothetical protein